MDLLIAAFPEASISVIVTQETEDYDAGEVERRSVFYPSLFVTIGELLDKYDGFDVVTVYGPKSYVDGIADGIKAQYKGRVNTVSVVGLEEM